MVAFKLTPSIIVNFFLVIVSAFTFSEYNSTLPWIGLVTITFWLTYHNFLGNNQQNLPNQETIQEQMK